jgi:hypothetical protein
MFNGPIVYFSVFENFSFLRPYNFNIGKFHIDLIDNALWRSTKLFLENVAPLNGPKTQFFKNQFQPVMSLAVKRNKTKKSAALALFSLVYVSFTCFL